MSETIRSVYEFDFVHDGQQVFRQILGAVSNPGKIRNIRFQAEKFEGNYGPLLAIGCTLLDNEEKMYVEKNPALGAELHNLTLCRQTELDRADYIFLSCEMNYGSVKQILKNVKCGTYTDPHDSATVIFFCEHLEGEAEMQLEGPGIDGRIKVKTEDYVKNIVQIMNGMKTEYPLGVDLIFADREGNVMGIPRLVRLMP